MEQEILDTVRAIKATQLTTEETMVYLLVSAGWSFRRIADELPFGFSNETARAIYNTAKPKFERQAEAGMFVTPVK